MDQAPFKCDICGDGCPYGDPKDERKPWFSPYLRAPVMERISSYSELILCGPCRGLVEAEGSWSSEYKVVNWRKIATTLILRERGIEK